MQYLPFFYAVVLVLGVALQILRKFKAAIVVAIIAAVMATMFLVFGQEYHTKIGPSPLPVVLVNLVLLGIWVNVLYRLLKLSKEAGAMLDEQ